MTLLVKAGSYTGNGSDPQAITGVGFQPKVVFIMGNSTAVGQILTDTMSSSFDMQSGGGSNVIASLNADGFTVNGVKNTNAVTFYYLALAGADCITGTYTGNATVRDITGLGTQPEWVLIRGETSGVALHSHAGFSGIYAGYAQNLVSTSSYSGAIDGFIADGFSITGTNVVNRSGSTFNYVAIGDLANFKAGSYTGNGTDDTDITGLGFDPESVLLGRLNQNRVWRTGEAGDLTSTPNASNAVANRIQAFITDGFEIGTDQTVNTSAVEYFYVAFGEAPASTFTASPLMHLMGVSGGLF